MPSALPRLALALSVLLATAPLQSAHAGEVSGSLQLDSAQGLLLARAGSWRLPAMSATLTAGGQDGLYWTAAPGQPLQVEESSDDALLIAVALQEVAPRV